MSLNPRGLVLIAPGINCNLETGHALEQVGVTTDQVHISQLRDGDVVLDDYDIFMLSGGFSYGDDISSGRILGLELRTRFAEDINRFAEAGKAIVGICNGFQVLVESGLLPDGQIAEKRNKRLSLINNANNRFECRWNNVRVEDTVCKLLPGIIEVEQVVKLPSAHQEGRIAVRDQSTMDELEANGQIVFRYVDESGEPTEIYPANPNGSPDGITGVCDENGIILGLMPHPERALIREQHVNWRRGGGMQPFGLDFFTGIAQYARSL